MPAFFFIRTSTTYPPTVPVAPRNQSSFNRDVSYAFDLVSSGNGNAGDILLRASPRAVSNFILCNGALLDRVAYPDLFDDIGESWGIGDGATTFNIPTQAQLWSFAAAPAVPPAQIVTSESVTSGTAVTSNPVGGTTGGAVDSGGRSRRVLNELDLR